MRQIDASKLSGSVDLRTYSADGQATFMKVEKIVDAVRKLGDAELLRLSRQYDCADLEELRVSPQEIAVALDALDPGLRKAINRSIKNQRQFQKSVLSKRSRKTKTEKGIAVWREWRAIDRVGLYVPGGLCAYPSTVIMNVVPAQVAGCRDIVMVTPAGADSSANRVVLATAAILGVDEIYKIGGAQAIAAMTYGTESIKKADKIVGPGNQYVTAAKQIVSKDVAIDMPAGPSEICIIADESANPAWLAADLLSQCEHDENAQAILVSNSKKLLTEVENEVGQQIEDLPTKKTAKKSFEDNAIFVLTRDIDQALGVVNGYAPEHLELQTGNNEALLSDIRSAGSVFVGCYSAEALGDYASGSNHVLPTMGFAKSFSGLSVESFGKWIEFQEVSEDGLLSIADDVVTLANAEGLPAHARAVSIRQATRNIKKGEK